jgi:hypothetical protein
MKSVVCPRQKYHIFSRDTEKIEKKNTKIKSKTDFYWIYGFVDNQFQEIKESWLISFWIFALNFKSKRSFFLKKSRKMIKFLIRSCTDWKQKFHADGRFSASRGELKEFKDVNLFFILNSERNLSFKWENWKWWMRGRLVGSWNESVESGGSRYLDRSMWQG